MRRVYVLSVRIPSNRKDLGMLSTKKALGLASMTAALVCTLGMGVKANAAEVTPPPNRNDKWRYMPKDASLL